MKLCLITSSFPVREDDIAAPFVPPLARALEGLGHQVWILSPTKYGAPTGWGEDERVYWFPWRVGHERLVNLNPRSPVDALRMWSLLRSGEAALLRLAREKKFDACVGLWAIPSGYLAWQAKKKLGLPFGVWALGSDINTWAHYPLIGGIIRATLRNADVLFADGFELARKTRQLARQECRFLSSMRPLPFERAVTIKLGVQPFHFLFVGRWEKVKGLDLLLQSVQRAVDKLGRSIFELVVVGSGVLEAEAREFVRAYGLDEIVRFVRQPPFEELLGYFAQASCVVIPSRSESIPLVFGEALQANAPLIVSDVGDMGNLAREYKVGQVVPPNDVDALTKALCDFVGHGSAVSARRADLVQLLALDTSARVMIEQMQAVVQRKHG